MQTSERITAAFRKIDNEDYDTQQEVRFFIIYFIDL